MLNAPSKHQETIPRVASRQVSDLTYTTDAGARYTDSRIHAHKRLSLEPQAAPDASVQDATNSLRVGSVAQKSEIANKKFPSGLSIERGSIDNSS